MSCKPTVTQKFDDKKIVAQRFDDKKIVTWQTCILVDVQVSAFTNGFSLGFKS